LRRCVPAQARPGGRGEAGDRSTGSGRLRVAFVTSHPIQYQAPLFRELARRPGIELTVLFCSRAGLEPTIDPNFGRAIAWDIPLLDGYRHSFLKNRSPRPSPSRATGLVNPGILFALRPRRFDAVIFHGYSHVTSMLGMLVCFARGIPVLLRFESHLLRPRAAWKRALKRLLLPRLFRRVSAFLTIGTKNEEYCARYGVPRERMFRTPYCVDNDRFARESRMTDEERRAFRAGLGLDPERPVVLFSGKLVPLKRPMDLLRAFDAAGLGGRASLVFIGDGVERAALEAYARTRLPGSVRFAGFVNQRELPRHYGMGDALVLPSSTEPWGLVVNEAMACGLKVLASDAVGAAYDLLVDPACGEVFPAGDVGALAAALRRAVESPGPREARMRAVERFSVRAAADGIVAALGKVAGRRPNVASR